MLTRCVALQKNDATSWRSLLNCTIETCCPAGGKCRVFVFRPVSILIFSLVSIAITLKLSLSYGCAWWVALGHIWDDFIGWTVRRSEVHRSLALHTLFSQCGGVVRVLTSGLISEYFIRCSADWLLAAMVNHRGLASNFQISVVSGCSKSSAVAINGLFI